MITVVGEALIHLARTSDASMLRASPGGSALNVAVAAARLGYPAALIARLSRDLYGQELRRYAEENRVDLSGATDADEPTMIAIDSTGPLRSADIIHAGAWDINWLYPGRAPQAVAEQWLGLGAAMVIVNSRKGCMVVRESGSVMYWPPASPARLVRLTFLLVHPPY